MKKRLALLPVFISFAAFAQQTKSATVVLQQAVVVTPATVVTATDTIRSNQPVATAQNQASLTLTPNTQLAAVSATAVTDTTLNMQKNNAGTTKPGVQMLDGTKSATPATVKAAAVPVPATHDKQPK